MTDSPDGLSPDRGPVYGVCRYPRYRRSGDAIDGVAVAIAIPSLSLLTNPQRLFVAI
nr:hypothetical protein [Clostridia bacterium]